MIDNYGLENDFELEVVCAWCGKHLGWKDGKGEIGISHGICDECKEKILGEYKEKRRR